MILPLPVARVRGHEYKLAVIDPRGPRLELPTAPSTTGLIMPSTDIISVNSKMGPRRNQGPLGDCVKWACARSSFEYEQHAGQADIEAAVVGGYFWDREDNGLPIDEDTGLSIQDGLRGCMTRGLARATTWPNTPENFAVKPPKYVEDEAALYKMMFAAWCPTLETIIASLLQGFPVVNGMRLTKNFEEVGPDGMYTPGGPDIGGHAQNITMVDLKRKLVFQLNQWGDFGFMDGEWMSWSLVEDGTISECASVRWAHVPSATEVLHAAA